MIAQIHLGVDKSGIKFGAESKQPVKIVHRAGVLFWDFDGVIKDSIEVKTQAFAQLFQVFGTAVAKRVLDHHVANGGMSRFDKFPLYLQWAGETAIQSRVTEFCDRFSHLVFEGVIASPWVPGVESYIRNNTYQQRFFVISATPQVELEQILIALNLSECFVEIFGAPSKKKDAIKITLASHGLLPQNCLMIGDALADLEAAQANQVPFILRRHESNHAVFKNYSGLSIKDFTAL